MDDHVFYSDLSQAIRNPLRSGRLIIARTDEERVFINEWLQQEQEQVVSINLIVDMIKECSVCREVDSRMMPVGSGSNGVMVVLNPPKLMNRAERFLFKKEAGELLKKMIASMNLVFDECYCTSMVKCDMTSEFARPSQILAQCERILKKEMEIVKPSVVIVFGDIMPLQKTIKESSGIDYFNVDHPITLIKNPELKRAAWNTLKLAMKKIAEKK